MAGAALADPELHQHHLEASGCPAPRWTGTAPPCPREHLPCRLRRSGYVTSAQSTPQAAVTRVRSVSTEKDCAHSWPRWAHRLFFLEKDSHELNPTCQELQAQVCGWQTQGSLTPTWQPGSPAHRLFSTHPLFVLRELKIVLSAHDKNNPGRGSAAKINSLQGEHVRLSPQFTKSPSHPSAT